MTICKILAPVVGLPIDARTLGTAIHFAKSSNAHVEALLVQADPAETPPFIGGPLMPDALAAVLKSQADLAALEEHYARRTVEEACAATGAVRVEKPEKSDRVTVSLRRALGGMAHLLSYEATLCDLVVFGAGDGFGTAETNRAIRDVLISSHRPVVVACELPARIRKIAIAWDGSATSARAIREAVPFLRCAESVDVITVQSDDQEVLQGQLGWYLARNRIAAEVRIIEKASRSTGEVLLAEATQGRYDLMVLGGFGHRPAGEALFGGITRTFLRHAPTSILLTH